MKNLLKTMLALGWLFAVLVSIWTILIAPNMQGVDAHQTSGVATRDARCAPHPVKFPCLQRTRS